MSVFNAVVVFEDVTKVGIGVWYVQRGESVCEGIVRMKIEGTDKVGDKFAPWAGASIGKRKHNQGIAI